MKKTVTVNLNGRVFTMDDDAYQLLDSYLHNLRIYFRKEEGSQEIVADFEARIEELFSDKLRLGYEVITLKDVEEVIARVGQPDDFIDANHEEEYRSTDQKINQTQTKKKFFRNTDDKMFGGICSGISAYFGWDVLPVRIVAVILLFATQFIIVPFYLIAWIIFPSAKTAEDKLQMRGKPITVENIGKTVAAEAETKDSSNNRGCLAGFLDFFVGLMKVCLIGLGILVALPILFALFIILIVVFSLVFGLGGGLLAFPWWGLSVPFVTVDHPILTGIVLVIFIGLPIVALIYAIIAYFAKLKPLHKAVKWACLGLWLVALILFFSFGIQINKNGFSKKWFDWDWDWHVTTVDEESSVVTGNGELAFAEYFLYEPVKSITLGNKLWSNFQIEQIPSDSSKISISGDENLIEKIKYRLTDDGELILSTHNNVRLKSDNNLLILIQTPGLNKIESKMLGNILIDKPFHSDNLEIRLEGAGRIQANDLQVGRLIVKSEGIGSTELLGNARYSKFSLEGAGEINAWELRCDSVVARVDGIGSLRCDPVKYLKAHMTGIGQIVYKSEPREKNTGMMGIGKIGRGE